MPCNDHIPDPIDLDAAVLWVAEAARLALSYRHPKGETSYKADGTPVTRVDRAIQDYLVDRIHDRYPTHGIIAEEGIDLAAGSETLWVIDPLDGTRAYASGLPLWGISVGILHQGRWHAGLFHMPALGDQYWGSRAGAFHNGVALPQLVAADFDESLGFLAVPSNAHLLYDITFPRLRSLGSTAAHLVYVARGAAVAALTRQVKLWDLAGVMPVLEHAGIALGYLSGAPFDGRDLMHGKAAAEPLLAAHPSWMERIRETIRLKRSDPAR